jgi:tRNA dimethylallyltransferase
LVGGRVPVLVGPTAVGKTAVALALAELISMEVISADSRQIYRRLDIGTAKPTKRERRRVTHHGLDLVDPGQRYSAGRFALDGAEWVNEIRRRQKLPVVVGGTGLYIRALAEGLFREPTLPHSRRADLQAWLDRMQSSELVRWAVRLDPGFRGGGRQRAVRAIELALLTGRPLTHWQRAARAEGTIEPWYVRLTVPRPVLHRRIEVRAREMIQRGLVEEVASVLAEGHPAGTPGLDAVGVREAVQYLHGQRDRESIAEAISTSTRQYAKRQETWFRHQLRGTVLTLDATRPPAEVAAEILEAWNQFGDPGIQ